MAPGCPGVLPRLRPREALWARASGLCESSSAVGRALRTSGCEGGAGVLGRDGWLLVRETARVECGGASCPPVLRMLFTVSTMLGAFFLETSSLLLVGRVTSSLLGIDTGRAVDPNEGGIGGATLILTEPLT